MDEVQQAKQAIQVIGIQMETLAQLPSVKQFIELSDKRALLLKTLPKEDKEGGDE
jgi:hypothetical protein